VKFIKSTIKGIKFRKKRKSGKNTIKIHAKSGKNTIKTSAKSGKNIDYCFIL